MNACVSSRETNLSGRSAACPDFRARAYFTAGTRRARGNNVIFTLSSPRLYRRRTSHYYIRMSSESFPTLRTALARQAEIMKTYRFRANSAQRFFLTKQFFARRIPSLETIPK